MSDWFYRAFEDRYRGTRDVIRARLTAYLPFIEALAQGATRAALDLGCGRGEWLELLGEIGFDAEGIDLDEGMLAACRERGLRVIHGDALAELRARPAGSLAVVSAFHLVEHIAFEQVQALIAEALRVLQPGGLLILETPNTENLVVGTSSFYDDPSHLRPLPAKLLAFAVEFGGFARHNVLRLQEAEHIREGARLTLFDVLAGVSPDYGLVAQKDGAPAQLAPQDTLFATRYGVGLHEAAQYYEQQQEALQERLRQLQQARDQQSGDALRIGQQLATVDAQVTHLHEATVAIAANIADIGAWREAVASDSAHTAAALAAGQAASAHVGQRLDGFTDQLTGLTDRLHDVAATLDGLGGRFAGFAESLERVEALAQRAHDSAQRAEQMATARGEQGAAQLRLRVIDMQQLHQAAVDEAARLAAHVAWIEGRLTHAESETSMLHQHMGELQRRHASLPVRIARALSGSRRRLAGTAGAQGLRAPVTALLRRTVRAVLARPMLKRVARRMVMRYPGLHTRLMRLMYAPVPADAAAPADVDPLTQEMSPRTLANYRALLAISKDKDN